VILHVVLYDEILWVQNNLWGSKFWKRPLTAYGVARGVIAVIHV